MNHGHVNPNPGGSLARCGGPGICTVCSREAAALRRERIGNYVIEFTPGAMMKIVVPPGIKRVELICDGDTVATFNLRKEAHDEPTKSEEVSKVLNEDAGGKKASSIKTHKGFWEKD